MKNYALNHVFSLITKNEKGGMAALLSVLVLSGIAVTTLTSAYVFLENRAKYNGRIIASYQTAYGMEDIAINLRQVYDSSVAVGATTLDNNGNVTSTNAAACPTGTQATNYIGMILCIPHNGSDVENSMYQADSNNAFGCPQSPCFCVRTSSGVGENGRYCMSLANPNTFAQEIEARDQMIVQQRGPVKKWFAKMEKFFDVTIEREKPDVKSSMHAFLGYELKPPTVLGWLLPESVLAYSKTYEEDRGHEVPETYLNYQTGSVGSDPKSGQGEEVFYPTPSRTQNTVNTESGYNPNPIPGDDPRGPTTTTSYQMSPTNCAGSQAATNSNCEMCTGLRCSRIIVESAMCAGQRHMCRQGGNATSYWGRMNIKFE